ncbi:peroxisomal N(1)-acetyl-spermine/spermidine oxidase [Danio rerio]|uniref:Peroxisomal N(1)-acetyl-spermine/spermidine oxidase n=2 Tax=Danio rerio TaxID=7955 RepID=B8JJQ4_DANRE|nr:peroxisomal N(1)-acetyl-spermine/spermidine oxidase [Danio rerio]XP_021335876.1 peroxisomal N(1)-acetyl-spermine/spermidine oxidase-like [Danio rerio]|eukprot:NP_001314981.1 peroxisomal N(1)-acetyl-spermine/spermidine oxidase [Danio rerio]
MDSMAQRPDRDSQIFIIGCGISGIGAAQKLIKHGFHNVRIIEATARSGGRIRTGRLGDNIIEIGANWIHGPSKENPVFRLACDYQLLDKESMSEENQAIDIGGHPLFVPNWFTSSGRKLGPETMGPALEFFMTLLERSQQFHSTGGEPLPSVGEFIKAEAERLAPEEWKEDRDNFAVRMAMINTLLKLECCVSGTHTMDDVGLGAFGMYTTLPGLDCTFPGGYEGLTDHMMKELPRDIVLYNKPVKCIHWNYTKNGPNTGGTSFPVTIECVNGETFAADHVIVTVPLGYMKKHQNTFLSPSFPLHKLHSIQRMGFGTNNKIFVEFEQPFWDEDCELIYLVWEDETHLTDVVSDLKMSWIRKLTGFTVLKPTERFGHVLCGWIAGQESEYMESLSELEVLQTVTQLLRIFTGNPTIMPRKLLRSQWFHEPYSCGSYSYVAKGCSGYDIDNLAEPLPLKGSNSKPLQVLFAGEATHRSFFSTVHGALLSGWREAERLISHHTSASGSFSSKL